MLLSNIIKAYSEDREDIDQSTRTVMLVLLREIIYNRIEIEALRATIISTVSDSGGDRHHHRQFYDQGLVDATNKWGDDLADINVKLNVEEKYNEKWSNAFKKSLNGTPDFINASAQAIADSLKIKHYDTEDQLPYPGMDLPLQPKDSYAANATGRKYETKPNRAKNPTTTSTKRTTNTIKGTKSR